MIQCSEALQLNKSFLRKVPKQYAFFFGAFFLLGFFVNPASAAALMPESEPDGNTIAVRATVPLTPEFVYAIKKNSVIWLTKKIFVHGEELSVYVKIAGAYDKPLRGHTIRLQVVKERGEELISISGETGADGSAHFSFLADADFLGSNTLRATDVTYDAPIFLRQEPTFFCL